MHQKFALVLYMIIRAVTKYLKGLFKRTLVSWPVLVLTVGFFAAVWFRVVIRDDDVCLLVGVPNSLIYPSLLISLLILPLHAIIVIRFCRNEIRQNRKFRESAILACLFIPFAIGATILALNGALNSGPTRKHQAKVLGTYQFRKTSYAKVQDWRSPKGFVLFDDPNSFLKEHPVGSTVNVLTRPGKFGYEYLMGDPNPKPIQR